jgi:hypothetical protein
MMQAKHKRAVVLGCAHVKVQYAQDVDGSVKRRETVYRKSDQIGLQQW